MKRSLDGGGIAPPPKKMNLEGSSSGTSGPAFDDLSAYEQMSVQFLLRKNAALVASVSSTKRQLGDAEARERAAQVLLDSRDNALSVYERQWAQLEEQLALLLASLEGASPREATAEPGAGGDSALLQLFTPVSPLEPDAKLEAPLQARTARMVEIGRAIVTAIASAKAGAGSTVPTDPNAPSSGGDALAQRLQVERAALTAEARRLRDQAAKAEAALVQSLDQVRPVTTAHTRTLRSCHPSPPPLSTHPCIAALAHGAPRTPPFLLLLLLCSSRNPPCLLPATCPAGPRSRCGGRQGGEDPSPRARQGRNQLLV